MAIDTSGSMGVHPADDHARDDPPDGPEQVAEDVQICSAHVDVVVRMGVQQRRSHDVDRQPDGRDAEHEAAVHDHRRGESLPRLDQDEPGDDQKRSAVDQSAEDFEPHVAERPGEPGAHGRSGSSARHAVTMTVSWTVGMTVTVVMMVVVLMPDGGRRGHATNIGGGAQRAQRTGLSMRDGQAW